jgi:pimeloyl-ACP methyl ester carboxylesterase
VSERTITTPDGRALRVFEAGYPDGTPILAIYGTPSSGMIYGPHARDAEEKGIRFVTFDRAGYGGSDPRPGRSIADVVGDVRGIADELGLDRLGVWGVSGGGPHALACAALLADRVPAVASLASVAPYGVEGLDWLEGMGEDNIVEFNATLQGRDAIEPFERAHREAFRTLRPEELQAQWATLLSPADAAVARADFAAYLIDSVNAALEPGVDGWLDDDLAFVAPWGFELDSIRIPVLLWQGELDLFVPPSHGRWLAEHIPGVEAHLSPTDGHLTLIEHRVPEVHDWLLARLSSGGGEHDRVP